MSNPQVVVVTKASTGLGLSIAVKAAQQAKNVTEILGGLS